MKLSATEVLGLNGSELCDSGERNVGSAVRYPLPCCSTVSLTLAATLLTVLLSPLSGASTSHSVSAGPPLVLSSVGELRAILKLPPELQGQALNVTLLGVQRPGEPLSATLPASLHVTFARTLPGASVPMLPVLVRADDVDDGRGFTLVFAVAASGEVRRLNVLVQWPQRARLSVQGPSVALALPDTTARVPFQLRNDGNAAAEVTVTSDAGTVEPSTLRLPAGAAQTVMLLLPPSRGERTATVTVTGGIKPQTLTLQVHGAAGTNAAYGLRVQSSVQTDSGKGTTAALTLDGLLSRITAVKATVERRNDQFQLKSASVAHGRSRLDIADGSPGNPAGEVGRGVYLAHAWGPVGVLRGVEVGLAVPATGLPRMGVNTSWQASPFTAFAAIQTTTQLSDPVVSVGGSAGPLTASALLAPERGVPWTAFVAYRAPTLDVSVSGTGGVNTSAAAQAAWRDAPGRPKFGLRANFTAGAFASLNVNTASEYAWKNVQGRIELALSADTGGFRDALLSGTAQGALDGTTWNLNGTVFLNNQGQARSTLQASTTTPVGAGSLGFDVFGSTQGTLDLAAKGVTYMQGLGGQWTLEGGVQALSVLTQPQLSVTAQAAYASPSGWSGFVNATVPFTAGGRTRVKAGLSYTVFVPTPVALADVLAGPDPTARTVRVVRNVNSVVVPLPGVRLFGCDRQFQTDANGQVTVTGPNEACRVTVNADDLPAGTVLETSTQEAAPGTAVTFRVVQAVTLRGQVQYTDPETGALLTDGPARDVRVNIAGPEERWAQVTLPGGTFEVTGLLPGKYQVFLDGEDPVSMTLAPGGAPVILRTPAPRRTVLDAGVLTPSLRLTWASVVLPAGQAPQLRLTAGAPLAQVEVQLGTQTLVFEAAAQPDPENWVLALPAVSTTGSVPITVTARFTSGAVTRRVTQVVVTPAP